MTIIWNKVTWYSKLLAVVVLAGTIWLGFYFNSEFKKVADIKPVLQTVGEIDTSDWKTYKNEKHEFEFKYPNTWDLLEGDPSLEAKSYIVQVFDADTMPSESDMVVDSFSVYKNSECIDSNWVFNRSMGIRKICIDKSAEELYNIYLKASETNGGLSTSIYSTFKFTK